MLQKVRVLAIQIRQIRGGSGMLNTTNFSFSIRCLICSKLRMIFRADDGKIFRKTIFAAAAALPLFFSSVFGSDLTRAPVDSVGYAVTPAQMEEVVRLSESRVIGRQGFPELPEEKMIGGICPHDDYIYAGHAYLKLTRQIDVPLVVIIGVSHMARRSGVRGKIVFDDYKSWKGPYGDIDISLFGDKLIDSLPEDIVLVSNELHGKEHSIEGILPFLQYPGIGAGDEDKRKKDHSGFEILPVLVTFLPGESFDSAVEDLSRALYAELKELNMTLGRDYLVLISADCVHYGDEGWGGRDHAPFGTEKEGYEKAVSRDIEIVETTLTGTLSKDKIDLFRETVDSFEFEWPYKIPWCGVYSIPFGLSLLCRLSEMEGRDLPDGVMIDYSTSLDPGPLKFNGKGTGATNIANLRHWVGYASVGYW